jgi:hypothetical protein
MTTNLDLISAATPLQWAGRAISGIVVAFLLFDATIKLLNLEVVRRSYVELGYPPDVGLAIGLIVLACALLYALPHTAVLGAVLITGLCGGAVASQLRIGSPLASHVLFGVYIGVLAWAGLWLRSGSVRSLLPFIQSTP